MTAATAPTSSLVPVQPVFTDAERLALAGFLAGYRAAAASGHEKMAGPAGVLADQGRRRRR